MKTVLGYIILIAILIASAPSPSFSEKGDMGVKKELVSPNPEVYPDGTPVPAHESGVEETNELGVDYSSDMSVESIEYVNSITDGQAEKILVIPIEFTDVKFDAGSTQAYFQNIMNQLKSYYEFNSNYISGTSGMTLDTVIVEKVVSDYPMAFYGNDQLGIDENVNADIYDLTSEAVQKLNLRGFDFNSYDTDHNGVIDHLMIIHAGYGQESDDYTNNIWSHRFYIGATLNPLLGEAVDNVFAHNYTMLPEYGQLGVYAHEFGHDLGLPDLYDADGDTKGYSEGVGRWDIMGSGSWNGSPAGSSPSNLSAWSRIKMGWATPTVASNNGVQQTVTNTNGLSTILRVNPNGVTNPSEYYLVEYRRLTGYDSGLPGGGVLVWHIDQARINEGGYVNNDASRLGVYPEQADGLNQLMLGQRGDAGDPFPGSTNNHNFTWVPYSLNRSNIMTSNSTYVDILNIQISGNNATFKAYYLNQAPGKATLTTTNTIIRQPNFSWSIVPGAQEYVLQMSKDSTFATGVTEIQLDSISDGLSISPEGVCSYTLNISYQLDLNYLYYSRILAKNTLSVVGNYQWSDTKTIDTGLLTTNVYNNCVEGNEDSKSVVIEANHIFYGNVTDEGAVVITGLPNGVTQGNISRSNGNKTITIELDGNSIVDYDADITLSITIHHSVLEGLIGNNVFNTTILATVEPKLTAPDMISFSFDGVNAGKIMGTDTTMQFSIDGGNTYINCSEVNMILSAGQLNSISATNGIKVRKKASLRNPASDPFGILIEAQTTPIVVRDDSANTISNMTTALEYSIDGGTTWTRYVDAASLPDLTQNVAVYVRSAATAQKVAGNTLILIFTDTYPAIEMSATLNAPSVEGSESTMTVTLDITSSYGTFSGTIGINDITFTGLPQGITKNTLTYNNNKSITISFTGNSTVDYDSNQSVIVTVSKSKLVPQPSNSVSQTFVLTATVETPLIAPNGITFSFSGNDAGKLLGTDSTMQASIDGGASYFDLTENTLTNQQIQVITASNDIKIRKKAMLRSPASSDFVIDILAQTAPAVTSDDTANTISGMTTSMEFSSNNGSTWQMYSGSLPDLTQTVTILVRYPAYDLYAAGTVTTLAFTIPAPPGGGPTIPVIPIIPFIEVPVVPIEVTDSVLDQTNKLGQVEIAVPVGQEEAPIVFTQTILDQINQEETDVVISQKSISMTFPANAIDKKLIESVGKDAEFNLEMGPIAGRDIQNKLAEAENDDGKGIFNVGGLVFEFKAQFVTEYKNTVVTEFEQDISITISLSGADLSKYDIEKLGVYWYNETTKTWDYVGGTYSKDEKTITFMTTHFSIYSVFETQKTFDDIKTHWAKNNIEIMASRFIIKGKSDTHYDPEAIITNAEFTALVIRALDLTKEDIQNSGLTKLKDVPEGKWYYNEVNLAYSLHILPEFIYHSVNFNPDNPITRESMAIIMAKGLSLKNGKDISKNVTVTDRFSDLDGLTSESLNAISYAVQEGLINGRTSTTFVPSGSLTRAEAATVIYRLLKNLENTEI